MAQKQSLDQQILKADLEREYLMYFNNYLRAQGLITPEEYRKMQVAICAENLRKTKGR